MQRANQYNKDLSLCINLFPSLTKVSAGSVHLLLQAGPQPHASVAPLHLSAQDQRVLVARERPMLDQVFLDYFPLIRANTRHAAKHFAHGLPVHALLRHALRILAEVWLDRVLWNEILEARELVHSESRVNTNAISLLKH